MGNNSRKEAAMADVIGKYRGFWKGGEAAFQDLKNVLEDTELPLRSKDPVQRVNALVSRASAFYSYFGDVNGLGKVRLLADAKQCLRQALREGNIRQVSGFSANQLDVLSTVALRGVRVLWIGLGPLAPDPKGAIELANLGLAAWAKETPEERAVHTYPLLLLDRIESLLLLGKEKLADEVLNTLLSFVRNNHIPDEKQRVRVFKRLGAVNWKLGYVASSRRQLDEAEVLAVKVAPGQVKKIRDLRWRLTRPWWHPVRWLIQIS